MRDNQYLSIFSGVGGSTFGAKSAGYEIIGAVEFDKKIGELYYQNHKSLVLFQDVKDVNPRVFNVDRSRSLTVQISPPCTQYSGANCHPDLTLPSALALDNCYHILDHLQPDRVIIENVRAYRTSAPMDRFRQWLKANGYCYIEQIVNCANVGVPQSRIRYFLMADRHQQPRSLPSTHSQKQHGQGDIWGNSLKPWVSWYEAIEDLIPEMQLTELSANQELALREWDLINHPLLIEGRTRSRAEGNRGDRFTIRSITDPAITVLAGSMSSAQMPKLLIPTIGYHSDLPPIYPQNSLAPTVKAMMMSDKGSERKGCWRLIEGREVREMSVRGLARLQTFPDDLILSGNKAIDCRCVGNAVPPIVLQQILEKCFD